MGAIIKASPALASNFPNLEHAPKTIMTVFMPMIHRVMTSPRKPCLATATTKRVARIVMINDMIKSPSAPPTSESETKKMTTGPRYK